ncbi:MAG: ATP-binding protein [Bacteroidota bacterium]
MNALRPLTLRFLSPPVEEAFRAEYARQSLRQVRLVLLVGLVQFAAFGFVDAAVVPDGLRYTLPIRAVGCAALAAAFAASFTPWFLRRMQAVVGAATFTAGVGLVSIIALSWHYGGDAAREAVVPALVGVVLIVVLFVHVLMRLRFVVASGIGWAIVAAYLVAAAWVGGGVAIATDASVLFAAGLSGMVASYVLERAARGEFAHAQALSSKNAELQSALHDLHEAQASLVQQEKMAALGRLTAGAAHELKNPLNFVNNFAELSVELAAEVRDELEASRGQQVGEIIGALDPLLADLEANAQKVREHGRRADAVVRGMGRHDAPAVSERRAVELNGLVEENVARTLWGMDGDVLTVERDYDPDAGTAMVDPEELGRAIQALVQNALDAVADEASSGDPAPEPRVVVRTRRADGVIRVEVEDNGAGVSADLHDRVFEPFFTTRPAGSGHLGLGLSLAHQVARSHGGTLEVGPGDGAMFTLTLPAAPAGLNRSATGRLVAPAP